MNTTALTHVETQAPAETRKTRIHWTTFLLLALLALYAAGIVASDGSGIGEEGFEDFYLWLVGLAKGALGKILTILFLIFGIAAGVARGSVAAAVPALGAAALLFFGPDIIDTIFTASLPGLI